MADEQIAIEITDKVASSIPQKIDRIASSARTAHGSVTTLQQALTALNVSNIDRVTAAGNAATARLQQAQSNAATASQRLQTELQRTATQTQRLGTEAQRTAAQAQRLATEQQRTASAAAQAAAAQDRAALAALRLQQAQDRAAAAANRGTSAFERWALTALSVGSVTLATAALLKYADAFTTLQNKLQNVTESQGQVTELTDRLYEVANRTRSGIDETATAFTRFDRSLKIMGKSQEETLRMTETINKGLIVSGATAQEAGSALLQLSQAFNAGKLQGDEFRSISENMPMILDATAKAMGVTIDQVKKMSTEGKITAKVLFDAMKILETQVDATFAKTAPTVGQAMRVLNNNVGKFVGETDKAIGASATLAKGILWLGNNVEIAALAVMALGAALLVAFGPQLLQAMTLATRAATAFSIALSANPVGIIVAAIALAITALALFSDRIKVSADGVVTLRDVFASVFSYIRIGFEALSKLVGAVWDAMFEWLSQSADTFGGFIGGMLMRVFNLWKASVNATIALAANAVDLVETAWNKLPQIMSAIFAKVYNFGVEQIESLVNAWIVGLQGIVNAASGIAPEMAKSMSATLEGLKVKFDRAEINKEGDEAGAALAARMSERFRTDYIGNAGTAIMEGARKIAEARKQSESLLRGSGTSQLSDGGDGKAAEKRAMSLAKINAQLDSQLANMYKLAPQRAIGSKMDEIAIQLAGRKIKLTQDETDALRAKVTQVEKAKAVQQEFDKLYTEVNGPQQTYNAQLEAADRLLAAGAISADRHAGAVARAKDAYQASVDPMYSVTKAANDQLAILQMQGPAMERERQAIEWRNKLQSEGKTATEAQTAAFLAQAEAVQVATAANDAFNRAVGNQGQLQMELQANQMAMGQVMANNALSTDQQTLAMQRLNVEAANLRLNMGDGTFMDALTAGMGRFVEGYKGVLSGLSDVWGNFFNGFVDGFANSIGRAIVYGENLQDMFSDVAKQIMSQMISALIKLGVQYLINQALGQSAMAAGVAASAAGGSVVAAAWAPAAAMVSLATFGANAGPAVMGMGAATVAAQSFAAISVPGFEVGGYTGNGGVSDVAGVVHGQEFVMNASATKKHRSTLEAMNNGASVAAVNANADGAVNGTKIVVMNFDFNQNIVINGSKSDSMEDNMDKAAEAISQKTQADIMDSVRSGGVWSKIIGN